MRNRVPDQGLVSPERSAKVERVHGCSPFAKARGAKTYNRQGVL